MRRGLSHFALLLCVTSCGPSAHTRAGGGVGLLSVHEVLWNPAGAALGHVQAVADSGELTVVFADTGATVLASGAVVAVDSTVKDWQAAAALPSADGSGPWLVGLSRSGHLYRLKDRSSLEDVSARYDLDQTPIRSLTSFGTSSSAFLLADQVALADGQRVSFYSAPGFEQLLGGGGRLLGVQRDALYAFGSANLHAQRYAFPGLQAAGLDAQGLIYAASDRAIYQADQQGELSLAYDSEGARIHDLTASGNTVWFAEGGELGLLESNRVLETARAPITQHTRLARSATSDIWAISDGTLQRFAQDALPGAAAWSVTVAPIFARVCSSCHEPGGVSGVDLSTAAAWDAKRPAIQNRVVETRTMPPEGHTLADADRAAIANWANASAPHVTSR